MLTAYLMAALAAALWILGAWLFVLYGWPALWIVGTGCVCAWAALEARNSYWNGGD